MGAFATLVLSPALSLADMTLKARTAGRRKRVCAKHHCGRTAEYAGGLCDPHFRRALRRDRIAQTLTRTRLTRATN